MSVSVILVSLHCTVDIAMTGMYYLLYCHAWHTLFILRVILVDCIIRVLYCTVGTAMTGDVIHCVCFLPGCLLS